MADEPITNRDTIKRTPRTDSKSYVWARDRKVPKDYSGAKDLSFANLHVYAVIPARIAGKIQMAEIELPSITLIGLSTHRDTYPVVSSGRRGIKGFTTGHAVVAGSLGFTITDEAPFAPLLRAYATYIGNATYAESFMPNELPPFDLVCVFKDDKIRDGAMGFKISGVKILDSSTVIGVDNLVINYTYSFMAMRVTEMMNLDQVQITYEENPKYYNQDTISKRATSPRLKLSFNWVSSNSDTFDNYDFGFSHDIVVLPDDEDSSSNSDYEFGIISADPSANRSLGGSGGAASAAEGVSNTDLGAAAPGAVYPW